MLKSYWVGWGGGGVVGGPCDYRVSPSPFGLDFGTLVFGTSDSGLTIIFLQIVQTLPLICTMYIVQILLVELIEFHF